MRCVHCNTEGSHYCDPVGRFLDQVTDSRFFISAVVGAVTGSALLGGLVGGDFLGGIVGDALDGDLED